MNRVNRIHDRAITVISLDPGMSCTRHRENRAAGIHDTCDAIEHIIMIVRDIARIVNTGYMILERL